MKVLIVEDETIIAARISIELAELGYEVTGMVTRADKALAHCQQSQPDIILLDIKLKGQMDGIELAQQLNESWDIPIVLINFSNSFFPAQYDAEQSECRICPSGVWRAYLQHRQNGVARRYIQS